MQYDVRTGTHLCVEFASNSPGLFPHVPQTRPFGHVRVAFKVEPVSVRVAKRSDPHPIANDRFRRIDAAGPDFTVELHSVFTEEEDRDAFAYLSARRPGIVPLGRELLAASERLRPG